VTSRFTRLLPHAVTAAAAAIIVLILLVPGAIANGTSVPAPPAQPTSADQIQNVDQVKTAIKAYYGDTVTSTLDPVNGTVQLHTFSPSGAYANEMAGVEADAATYLDKAAKHDKQFSGTPAVLFDIDDTTLNTYSYEIYSNFVFNPATNAAFVNNAVFPATPGMPALVSHARDDGYTVFFLTGRPEAQRPGTVTNLANAGYGTEDKDHLFLKDNTAPWLASCAPTCSTTQYKSLTREHIESLGFDIVANFGDQFSDLNGGFADQTFKIPNPMYFLP
jgi:HAD superfamily, subfamily IIIB (Acid phosphatase)